MAEALTWGDVVQVVETAPEALQPGRVGSIFAVDIIQTEEYGRELGLPVGTTIISVEFPDASTITTEPRLLRKVALEGSMGSNVRNGG